MLAMASIFAAIKNSAYSLELSRTLLTISATALSITVAIVALYHHDFLAEMDLYVEEKGKRTRLAGRQIASDYKNNFGLLLITSLFLSVSITFLLFVNLTVDTLLLKAIALWAFLSAIGSLVTFVIFFTYRLFADARFLERHLTR